MEENPMKDNYLLLLFIYFLFRCKSPLVKIYTIMVNVSSPFKHFIKKSIVTLITFSLSNL